MFINFGDFWSNNEVINFKLLLIIVGVMKIEIYNVIKLKVCIILEWFIIFIII